MSKIFEEVRKMDSEVKSVIVKDISNLNKTIEIFVKSINALGGQISKYKYLKFGVCQMKETYTIGGLLAVKKDMENRIYNLCIIRNKLIEKLKGGEKIAKW